MSDWQYLWKCKCGAQYNGRATRFTSFGFNCLCRKCGEDIGDHGPYNQVQLKIVKWVRSVEFNILKPSTWFADSILQEKSNAHAGEET